MLIENQSDHSNIIITLLLYENTYLGKTEDTKVLVIRQTIFIILIASLKTSFLLDLHGVSVWKIKIYEMSFSFYLVLIFCLFSVDQMKAVYEDM